MESETNHIHAFNFAKTRLECFAREFPAHIKRCFSACVNSELEVINTAISNAPEIYHSAVESLKTDILKYNSSSEEAVTMTLCRESTLYIDRMRTFNKIDAMKIQVQQLLSANEDLNSDVSQMAKENAVLRSKNLQLTNKVTELTASNDMQRRKSLNLSEDCSLLRAKLEKSEHHVESMQKQVQSIESERSKELVNMQETERQADAGKWHKRVVEKMTEEHRSMRQEIEKYKE